MTVRNEPCSACPYRRDAPSGLWSETDYDKLDLYDQPTDRQPLGAFSCHATPDHLCHGWAVVADTRGASDRVYESLALRLYAAMHDRVKIPEATVPLFDTHTEAADHGRREIEAPSDDAIQMMDRLARKYPRISRAL